MTRTIESAPAKIILVGEHAVVYDYPAVALPFPPLSAQAEVTAASETLIRSERYPGLLARLRAPEEIPSQLKPVSEAVRSSIEAIARLGGSVLPLELSLKSEIPPGAGLGSSAAIAVATIRAVFAHHDRTVPPALLRLLATQAEAIAHGASSGLDPTTVAAHGPIRFVRDHAPVDLRITAPFGLVVADSGEPSDTGEMVMRVRARLETSEAAGSSIRELGELADQAAETLEAGDYRLLGMQLNNAHAHLTELGIGTRKLEAIIQAARASGAYGAKLSGAGGGGCAIALVPLDHLGAVASAMVSAGAVAAWPTQYLIEGSHEAH